jgi:hypothetical protein
VLRRWYVVVLALAAGILLLLRLDASDHVYTTTTAVTFVLPPKSILQPYSGANNKNVIAFATSVAQEVNDGKEPAEYAHGDAPLYGAGIRQATLVGVPDNGGQWAHNYSTAEIDVEVVGPTRDWVSQSQAALVAKVLQVVQIDQDELGVPSDRRISATVVPATREITRIAAARSHKIAATGAILAAALLVGGWCAVAVDGIRLTRAAQRRPSIRPSRLILREQ